MKARVNRSLVRPRTIGQSDSHSKVAVRCINERAPAEPCQSAKINAFRMYNGAFTAPDVMARTFMTRSIAFDVRHAWTFWILDIQSDPPLDWQTHSRTLHLQDHRSHTSGIISSSLHLHCDVTSGSSVRSPYSHAFARQGITSVPDRPSSEILSASPKLSVGTRHIVPRHSTSAYLGTGRISREHM